MVQMAAAAGKIQVPWNALLRDADPLVVRFVAELAFLYGIVSEEEEKKGKTVICIWIHDFKKI